MCVNLFGSGTSCFRWLPAPRNGHCTHPFKFNQYLPSCFCSHSKLSMTYDHLSREITFKSFLFQYNMLRWLLTRPERKCKILGKSGGDCFVMPLHVRGDNNAVSVFVLIEFDRLKNNVQLSALSCRFMWEESGTGRHFSNTLNNLTFRLSMFNFQSCHVASCERRHFSNTLNSLTFTLSTFN